MTEKATTTIQVEAVDYTEDVSQAHCSMYHLSKWLILYRFLHIQL